MEHTPAMLKLVRQVYEEEGTDLTLKTGAGLIGDLAETFPNGQLKELLLSEWVVAMLKTKTRNADLKKTLRWAREVRLHCQRSLGRIAQRSSIARQARNFVNGQRSIPPSPTIAPYFLTAHRPSLFPYSLSACLIGDCMLSTTTHLKDDLEGPKPLHSTPTGAQL